MMLLPTAAAAQTRTDLFIATLTQDSVDATYYTPATPPPPAGYPGIIFVHGFGGSKHNDTANGRVYAVSGYATLSYSVRGHGLSSGGSTILSDRERLDLAKVVEFFRALPGVDSASVGISGGSQGGLHGHWAIADRLPVRAVSSDVIVPRWATDMLMNGSVRRTVVNLLRSSRVRYDAVRDTLWELLRADDFEGFRTAFTAGRDVDTAALNSSTVPSLRLLKWQDHYFTAADGIEAFRRYPGPKKIYLGTRGHFSDHVESERTYVNDQITRWLKHHLRGIDTGIMDEPMVTYAASSLPMDTAGYFLWTRTGTGVWPPPGVQHFRLYFHADSTLDFEAAAAPAPPMFLANVHADTGYGFDDAYNDGFQGSRFDASLPRQALVFESEPLPWDVEWIGSPRMSLSVTSSSPTFPLHAQIYEVDTAGTKYFVNRINYTARGWPGGDGVIEAEGIAHAHRFTGGNRIRVELTNIDVTNRIDYGIYPFVLPVLADAGVSVHAGPFRTSYIEIPFAQSPLPVETAGLPPPEGPSLLQNYPNPFNASTTITAVVPAAGRLRVAVYDAIGREVAVPADGEVAPGRHRLRWDASAFASGIYFARLTFTPHGGGRTVDLPAVRSVRKLALVR